MRALFVLLLMLLAWPATARELRVATWDLAWLTARQARDPSLPADVQPKRPEDIARLRRYAEILNADVVTSEGVDGPTIAAEIFPPDRCALHLTADQVVLRVGFAVRRGISFTANPDLAALEPEHDTRFPLRSGADVTLDLGAEKLRLLAVHLKSGCARGTLSGESRACDTLRKQLIVLESWIAARRGEAMPYLILGREMEGRHEFFAGSSQFDTLLRPTSGLNNPAGAARVSSIISWQVALRRAGCSRAARACWSIKSRAPTGKSGFQITVPCWCS
jgi:hypothetical protein